MAQLSFALLFSDPLPLRRVTDLPGYRVDHAQRFLPWVFGRATLAPVPLDLMGQEWLVADHPVAAVTRVTVAGKVTQGWQLQQRLDATGHAVSVLRLAQPTTTDPVAVTVAGRQDAVTGALLQSPGAVVRELMRLCGHAEPVDAWSGLDAHVGTIDLGMVLQEPMTLRAALASVVEPLGMIWRPGWAGPDVPQQPLLTLDLRNTESISARADTALLATTARVLYAHDWAVGGARGALGLGAPDAQAVWGDLPLEIDLPGVRYARDALDIATRTLAMRARPIWTIEAEVDDRAGALRAGQTVALRHPLVPSGLAVVTALTHNREAGIYNVTAKMHTAAPARVVLLQRSGGVDPAGAQPTGVSYRDGVATFVITDDQGNPLAGAAVTLDGAHTLNTNGAGQVQFRTPRGSHVLTVQADGFASFEIEVLV